MRCVGLFESCNVHLNQFSLKSIFTVLSFQLCALPCTISLIYFRDKSLGQDFYVSLNQLANADSFVRKVVVIRDYCFQVEKKQAMDRDVCMYVCDVPFHLTHPLDFT